MGSICAGRTVIETCTPGRAPITCKDDIHFATSKFVQENSSGFYQVYELGKEPLGCGGFGSVWICTHKRTGDVRAVKILPKASFSLEEIKNRSVFDEVQILRSIDHPYIVKVFEYFEDECNFYIVMEHIDGKDLFDLISDKGRLTEEEASSMMKKILMGVSYLHLKKIIHRDLKPENILVQLSQNLSKSDLKIIDFNVSMFKHEGEYVAPAGTIDYMAPEVFNQKADEKSDIWSCGVILYLMVTGYLPFGAENDELIQRGIKKGLFIYPPHLEDSVSLDCKSLISSMLTKDPSKRLSAAQALEHSWFSKPLDDSCDYSVLTETLSGIKESKNVGKLREVITTIMISQMSKGKEMKKAEKYFSAIDKNKDGIITIEELIEMFCARMPRTEAEEQATRIMKILDVDGSGAIDFSEFLRICIEEEEMLTRETLKKTFDYLDKNGTNKIEKEDLKEWLNNSETVSDSIILDLMLEADKNGVGHIEYKEFEELFICKKIDDGVRE